MRQPTSPAPEPLPAQGLFARALRGTAITALAYAAGQALRFAANLILARLLFPEAFGLMALVTVVIVGLQMFSDLGLGPAVMRSARGDDPAFLRTAWTLQVARGLLLALVAAALAWPLAAFYQAPDLALLVPVAALALAVAGFNPIRIETANRHLALGLVTAIDLAAQAIGVAAMVALAAATGSVWALVAGSLVQAVAKLVLAARLLPGPAERPGWDPAAARELLHFGGWIMASTVCGFALAQGDRLILGAHLSLAALGHYNIGYFLASFPWLLGGAVVMRVMIPLYRDEPLGAKAAHAPRLRRLRRAMTAGLLAMLAALALGGVWLVEWLYDARYRDAGAVVVLVACAQMPAVVGMTYDQAALAAGDSRRFFAVLLAKALLQTGLLLAGVTAAGLTGAIAGMGAGLLLSHPLIVWLARRHGVWDGRHDVAALAAAGVAAALALWLNGHAIRTLG
jgi:O-antigen/teichoic acid export membrane protein